MRILSRPAAKLSGGSTRAQSSLPSIASLFGSPMTGSLVDERRAGESAMSLRRLRMCSVHKGHITQHWQQMFKCSCDLCVLSFSIFLRLTERYRGFLLFSLSAVDLPWAHASWHQCYICFFGQMWYPSCWDLGWIMELTGNQTRKKKEEEEEEWGCIVRHFILKVYIIFRQSKILAHLRN